jgi:uncharacterized protein (DUF305 family)
MLDMKQVTLSIAAFVVTALLLGACGAETPAGQPIAEAPAAVAATPTVETPTVEPSAVQTTTETQAEASDVHTATEAAGDTAGMDHGTMDNMDHGAMGADSFDLHFIDSMIPHHEGAIAMAQQALEQAEHEEIRQLAQAIIDAQQGEIAQLQEWRTGWYTDTAPTEGMGAGMGMMAVPEGVQPFDLRFIDAMIPHHQGAIDMAHEALMNAQHAEIKQLAQAIVDAQEAEIAQLQEWRAAWYPDAQ